MTDYGQWQDTPFPHVTQHKLYPLTSVWIWNTPSLHTHTHKYTHTHAYAYTCTHTHTLLCFNTWFPQLVALFGRGMALRQWHFPRTSNITGNRRFHSLSPPPVCSLCSCAQLKYDQPAPCACCHAFHTMVDSSPSGTIRQNNPFLPQKLLLSKYSITAIEKQIIQHLIWI